MTDEELRTKQDRLDELNVRDVQIREHIEAAVADAKALELEVAKLGVKQKELQVERAANKAEYGRLYEEVGRELKAREAEE